MKTFSVPLAFSLWTGDIGHIFAGSLEGLAVLWMTVTVTTLVADNVRYIDLTEQNMRSIAFGGVQLHIQTMAFGCFGRGKVCSRIWNPGSVLGLP